MQTHCGYVLVSFTNEIHNYKLFSAIHIWRNQMSPRESPIVAHGLLTITSLGWMGHYE